MKTKRFILLVFVILLLSTFVSCKKKSECEKNGHQYVDATCINPKTCKICGMTEGEALGHDYSDAICTKPKTCKRCNMTDGDSLGHNWNDGEIIKKATCTESGMEKYTCDVCKEIEERVIDPLGHKYSEATHLAPATCERCGDTIGEKLPSVLVDAIQANDNMSVNEQQEIEIHFSNDQAYQIEFSDDTMIELISQIGSICVIKALKEGQVTLIAKTTDMAEYDEISITISENTFAINYKEKDNVVLPEIELLTYKPSELPLQLPVPTKEGYYFLGWATPDIVTKYGNMALELWDTSILWKEIPVGTTGDLTLTPMFGYTRFELDVETTIIDMNDNLKVNVIKKYFSAEQLLSKIVFASTNDEILTIDEEGIITPKKTGYTTITVSLEDYSNINITLGITVVEDLDGLDELLKILIEANVKEVIAKNITVTGYQFIYGMRLRGSVSNYLFAEHFVDETILTPLNSENRPGDVHEKYYICVHDTASSAKTADAKQHAQYVQNGGGGTSWHYSAGDTGIYHQIPDNERAYHAGDGSREYHLNDSGLLAKPNAMMKVTISEDGYFEIDGEKSQIKAPLKSNNQIPTTSEINDAGIRVVVQNGKYYIGDTWWSDTYKRVSNTGGNVNSIGIETMVNQGSDLYLTWQKTAKLVAHLLIDNNLTINDVKPHHFFSGKNCPQTMRDNDLWDNFLTLVSFEYRILKDYSDYEISFESLDKTYVNDKGRVIKQEMKDITVSYNITVTKDGVSKTITLSTIIPGNSRFLFG